MRKVVIPLVGGLLTLVVALAAAASARARSVVATPAGGVTAAASKTSVSPADAPTAGFRNVREGLCLQDRQGLSMGTCDSSAAERFWVFSWPNYRVFQNVATLGCLTDSGLRPWDPTCTLEVREEWRLLHFSNGAVGLRNHYTARCLDYTRAGGLRTWPCNGTTAQQWFSSVT